MKIALDWDDTFTRDPLLWASFVETARKFGHEVRIVTFRDPDNLGDIKYELDTLGIGLTIHCTGGVQKREFCESVGYLVDVWIDDGPEFIVKGLSHRVWTQAEKDEYRLTRKKPE